MRKLPLRLWLLAAGSAFLQWLPFPIAGPAPLWRRFFCWFCLAPLLVALRGFKRDKSHEIDQPTPGASAKLGYLSGVLWYLGNCYWIYQTMYLYGGLPKPVALGILLLFSLYLGLYHALFGWIFGLIGQRFGWNISLIAVPFLWVAVELGRARITGFPWDLLGYMQVDNQLFTQLAPVGGVMLLSFVIAAINAWIAGSLFARSARLRVLWAGAGLALAVLVQMGVMYVAPQDMADHYATLLQENLAVGNAERSIPELTRDEKYRQFIQLSENPVSPVVQPGRQVLWLPALRDSPQDFIVWPEAPADFVTTDPMFRSQVSALAKATKTTVISGSVGVDVDAHAEGGYHEFGSAAVFNKDGAYAGRYDKIHRVPWGEYVPYKQLFFFTGQLVAGVGRMEPGSEYRVFQTGGRPFGIFICYESIFGDEVRKFAKDGAEVLVNISDDGWYGDTGAPWQHLDMERMRAIENRRWILRDTNTGVTTAVDPHGRGVFTTPRHVRAAYSFPFGYRNDTTFYTRHGDWFAWLCAAVTLGILVAGFVRRRSSLYAVH